MAGAATLFELGRRSLVMLKDELARCGIPVDPKLELRRGEGVLCYYNLNDGHIYLSLPDPATPHGKFELLFFRALIHFDNTAEVMRLLELIIPWLIAHEVGHHLRHKFGLYTADQWREEAIANQLAIAFTRQRLSTAELEEVQDALARAIAGISRTLASAPETTDVHVIQTMMRYILTHMAWFHHDLTAAEEETIAALAHRNNSPFRSSQTAR
jgi:hypothetical protein